MDFDVQKILDASKGAELLDANGTPLLVMPGMRTLVDVSNFVDTFERTLPAPRRRRGLFQASDIDSLVRWGKDNATADMPMFAVGLEKLGNDGMWKKPELSLQVIGNYSAPIKGADGEIVPTAWHDFSGIYKFPVSEPWAVWCKGDGVAMGQGEFALFIEDRMADLARRDTSEQVPEYLQPLLDAYGEGAEATPNRLLELSRGMQLRANQTVKQAVRLESGEGEVQFVEEHTDNAGAKLKVPSLFWIRVPVFLDSDPKLVGVRLRYRLDGGKVKWSYSLYSPQIVVKDEFEKAVAEAESAGRTVFFGAPDMPPPAMRTAS